MYKRSIIGFSHIVSSLQEDGIDTKKVLEKYGLKNMSIDPNAMISRTLELKVVCELVAKKNTKDIALKSGAKIGLASCGIYAMLLMSCKTVYEAVKNSVRFGNLCYSFGKLTMRMDDGIILCIQPDNLPLSGMRFLIDRDLSAAFQILKEMSLLTEIPFKPKEVWLPYGAPENIDMYRLYFSCEIKFNKPCIAIILDNRVMSTPLPQANIIVCDYYKNICEEALISRSVESCDLGDNIYNYLDLFTHDFPGQEDTARAFKISERVLRKDLKDQGTSYREICNNVKMNKAKTYLVDTRLSVSEISYRLGYKDTSSFNHAFRRWLDLSPLEYRNDDA